MSSTPVLGDRHRNSSHVPYLETVEEATDYEGILPQLPTPLFPGHFFSVDGVAQVSASMISPSGQGSEILGVCLEARTECGGLAACMGLAKQG